MPRLRFLLAAPLLLASPHSPAPLAAAPPALSTAEETPERDRYAVLVRCGAFSVRDAA